MGGAVKNAVSLSAVVQSTPIQNLLSNSPVCLGQTGIPGSLGSFTVGTGCSPEICNTGELVTYSYLNWDSELDNTV